MRQFIIFLFCLIVADSYARNLRITNNDRAAPGEFPHQVSLQLNGAHTCGGALITKRHVVTAAQCVDMFTVYQTPLNQLKVVVGSITTAGGVRMDVDKIVQHGSYVRTYFYNNVAIITLKKAVTESQNVRPISLPQANEIVYSGDQLTVSGFGSVLVNGPVSPYLKKLRMQAIDQATCKQYWQHLFYNEGQMCATHPQFGICLGDAGTPVVNNRNVLVAIVSGGNPYGCASSTPDLFTKLAPYLNFIRSQITLAAA